jgi:hypothetical protein
MKDITVNFKCYNGYTSTYKTIPIDLAMLCYMLDHEELVKSYTVEYQGILRTPNWFNFGYLYSKWIDNTQKV